jgi:hypothetical protein
VRPLLTHMVQSNCYDCGLWILAAIAAVLRGKHMTGFVEGDMRAFRQELLRNILYLFFFFFFVSNLSPSGQSPMSDLTTFVDYLRPLVPVYLTPRDHPLHW